MADYLVGSGLEKGDRVGVVVHNGHQFIEIYFAVAKTGGIFCPYNNHVRSEEMKDLIQYSSPKFLFIDRDFGDMISGLKPALGSVAHYICLQKPEWPGMEDYESSIASRSGEEPASKIVGRRCAEHYFHRGHNGQTERRDEDSQASHVRCDCERHRPEGRVR